MANKKKESSSIKVSLAIAVSSLALTAVSLVVNRYSERNMVCLVQQIDTVNGVVAFLCK